MNPSGRRPFIVWCSGMSWDGVAGTDRHMAAAMATYTDILWVDPAVSPLTKNRRGASRLPISRLTRVNDAITRLETKTVPFHSKGALRSLTAWLVRHQIGSALARMRRVPEAMVVSHFQNLFLPNQPEVARIFYGTDDHVGASELRNVSRRLVEIEEREQLDKADVIVAISEELADRWRRLGFGGRLAMIPNGVQAEAYRDMEQVVPVESGLERPVAGLVGMLNSRIDIRLLESVLDAGCSLLIVGPHDPVWEPRRFQELLLRPRVKWTGPVEFNQLPRYLKAMDVGITPYADSEFNRASFPLKTLEYLAAGIPAVSTDLPAVRWLGTDLITVADRETFGEAVLNAARGRDSGMAQKRAEFAAVHSWNSRARTFVDAIGVMK